jgi:predicted metalloprotease with PDZ domain
MQYSISRNSSTSQFIQITLNLPCYVKEEINLQLAAWRPGRYELANYAQKIRGFEVFFKENKVSWKKKTKDLWQFESIDEGVYKIHYEFYANQMDAGGTWSDESQLYLNFSNFIFEILGRENESINVTIDIPQDYLIATSLPLCNKHQWSATSYQHLMDSPLLASQNLQHYNYQISNSKFHLWFNGEIHFDIEKLTKIFSSFTKCQIEAFGAFPAQDYHFIFQLLPHKHYHGVEHKFSTVITFGPAKSLAGQSQMKELIGVSSHELYHFWNVCRIRPKGILPYDLSKEVYLNSGVVLEGVTTYMGDLFLLKSGFFSLQEYCTEILDKLLQKEFDSFGWQNQSITASSFDLWLDGYKVGIPDKKVSIYNRGALISLCLDLLLIKSGASLSQVMKVMWFQFGEKEIGYELADYRNIISSFIKDKSLIEEFFDKYIFGKDDLKPILKTLLAEFGIQVNEEFDDNNPLLHQYGVWIIEGNIKQIHPESDAYFKLMVDDKILNIRKTDSIASLSNTGESLSINIERYGRKLEVEIKKQNLSVFPRFKTSIIEVNKYTELWIG